MAARRRHLVPLVRSSDEDALVVVLGRPRAGRPGPGGGRAGVRRGRRTGLARMDGLLASDRRCLTGSELVCVLPGDDPASARFATIEDGEVAGETVIRADG